MTQRQASNNRLLHYHSWIVLTFLLVASLATTAQGPLQSFDSIARSKQRQYPHTHAIGRNLLLHGSIYAGTLYLLNEAWYQHQPRAPLHSFDDRKEWLQIDKIGHAWTSYQLGRAAMRSWKTRGDTALAGMMAGWSFMTIIEFLDARAAVWGWSWSDIGANSLGSGLFYLQQRAWKEQRIQLKFSAHTNSYTDPLLRNRAQSLYGQHLAERILKDYNGQTYWLSVNVASFSKNSALPAWLNVAVGYGGSGLWGGFENIKRDVNGTILFDKSEIPRLREYYLSPDVDFTKIKTNKKWVRELLWCLNAIKMPAPAMMINQQGKLRVYPVYF